MYQYFLEEDLDNEDFYERLRNAIETGTTYFLLDNAERVHNTHYAVYVYNDRRCLLVAEIYSSRDASCKALKPTCLIRKDLLFIGCDFGVYSIDLRTCTLQMIEITTYFYDFLCYKDVVIIVCEAEIIFLTDSGQQIESILLHDMITNFSITSDGKLLIDYFEGDREVLTVPKIQV